MPAVVANVLVNIAEILSGDRDLNESLRLVCRELARATSAPTVSVYLLSDERRALYPAAAYRVPKNMLEVLAGASLPLAEQGFTSGVFTDGRVAWTDDVPNDPRFEFHLFRLFPHQSGAVIPLLLDGRVGGAFYLTWWNERRRLDDHDTTMLAAIGRQVALLLRNARLLREAERGRADAQGAELRYRRLFENVPVGVLRTLPDGTVVDANSVLITMLGYSDLDGFKAAGMASVYMDLADRRRFQETIRRDGAVVNFDVQFRRRDGTLLWVRLNVRIVEQDGQMLYEGVLQDVSDLRRVEDAVRQAEALAYVAKLAKAAAHEINNPLAIITGRLQLLQRLIGDPATVQKIEPAVEAARRIADIVSYMGRISRLEERPDTARSPMLDIRRSGADAAPP
jgi:PAS domain S-box-containing protein